MIRRLVRKETRAYWLYFAGAALAEWSKSKFGISWADVMGAITIGVITLKAAQHNPSSDGRSEEETR